MILPQERDRKGLFTSVERVSRFLDRAHVNPRVFRSLFALRSRCEGMHRLLIHGTLQGGNLPAFERIEPCKNGVFHASLGKVPLPGSSQPVEDPSPPPFGAPCSTESSVVHQRTQHSKYELKFHALKNCSNRETVLRSPRYPFCSDLLLW
jgi:hypothetical protein